MIAPDEHFANGALDTSNVFVVGAKAGGQIICILNPPTRMPLARLQALNLAAWIVCLADPGRADFDRIVRSIQNT